MLRLGYFIHITTHTRARAQHERLFYDVHVMRFIITLFNRINGYYHVYRRSAENSLLTVGFRTAGDGAAARLGNESPSITRVFQKFPARVCAAVPLLCLRFSFAHNINARNNDFAGCVLATPVFRAPAARRLPDSVLSPFQRVLSNVGLNIISRVPCQILCTYLRRRRRRGDDNIIIIIIIYRCVRKRAETAEFVKSRSKQNILSRS